MLGQIKLDIHLKSGDIDKFVVDAVFGWNYSGDYLLVNQLNGETIPYYFGDIDYFTRESAETIH